MKDVRCPYPGCVWRSIADNTNDKRRKQRTHYRKVHKDQEAGR